MDGGKFQSQAAAADPRDGLINFSNYSDEQLKDLADTIDQARFPANHRNVLAEMGRRASAVTPESLGGNRLAGRYTRNDGLRGWLQAKAARCPVYGAGTIERLGGEVILNGWQRTWLGTPIQGQVAFSLERIRNVARDRHVVALEIKSKFLPARRIEFKAEDVAAAAHLVAELPDHTTPGFPGQWARVREFNTQLRSVEKPLAVVPALVAVNCLVFLVMWIVQRTAIFDPQTLISSGGNFGPLTVNGQWWRLISATFLHANPMHLIVNMWALWNVGRLCERLFGRITFALLYICCAGIASITSTVWNPALVSVGASGAIFGVLGAFLAFYLKPGNRVPAAIARRHWLSASAFTLFNLISGALQPGVDNAAHVGGLIAGFVLGWILGTPLEVQARSRLPLARSFEAAAFVVLSMAMAIWQVKGIGSELTANERYLQRHGAYLAGETKNLRLWNELATSAAGGTMSDEELANRFERDIVPFWKAEHAQIDKENLTLKGAERPFALLVADFVRIRFEWAQEIVDGIKKQDPDVIAKARNYNQQDMVARARLERVNIRSQMDHRPRALVNTRIVTKVRNALTGYRWQCVRAPAVWAPVPMAADNPKDGPSERFRVGCLAQQLFMTADYAELDELMLRYSRSLGDLPDGSSRYQGLIAGLDHLFEYGGIDGPTLLGRTSDWRRAVKNSQRADLAEALILEASAWSARGHGGTNSVSAQAWQIFAYRTEMAAAALDDIKARNMADAAWYSESLGVALNKSQDTQTIRNIFNEGFSRFPAYRPIERQMLRALMPRWGGSYDKVEQFIRELESKVDSSMSAGRYAELYSEYSDLEGDDVNIFTDANALWTHMRAGYAQLIKRYPASDVILNEFAAFACRADDGYEFEALRASLDKRLSSVAWSTSQSLHACDAKFAQQTAMAKQREADRQKMLSPAPVLSLGGVRLGMTSEELLAAKGRPLDKQDKSWTYNASNSTRAGVLTVAFSTPANADGKVVAISYTGDEASAPRELPYLNGMSEDSLRDQYGNLIGMGSPSQDVTSLKYRNGVYADTRNGKVFRYGIYAVQLPRD
jgi:rhomboid protease GluP